MRKFITRKYTLGRFLFDLVRAADYAFKKYEQEKKEINTMKPFKQGDDVFDIILGIVGVVDIVCENVVLVSFPSFSTQSYRLDGRKDHFDKKRRLYHIGEAQLVSIEIPPRPKKKVKAYKWVVKAFPTSMPEVTGDYYREDRIYFMGWEVIQRIDSLFIEVDE